MAKEVYIIAGGNGCGKTTLAHTFIKDRNLDFLNADEIASDLGGKDIDSYKISAGKIFLGKIDNFIKEEKSFALESTLSGKYLAGMVERLKRSEYFVKIVYVFVNNVETSVNRVKTRILKGGHSIPEEDIRRRYLRSISNFKNIYQGLVDEWEIHYNGDNEFELIALSAKENLVVLNEDLYNKFLSI